MFRYNRRAPMRDPGQEREDLLRPFPRTVGAKILELR
jgi:hypothetical protein